MVRALAQRSADAAKEIKTLILASSSQVEVGVKLVDATGKTLERIMEQVARINTTVAEIAKGAQDQACGICEVNIAIAQMDQMTQQNAAMAEQSTAATAALTQEAEQLTQLVRHFRLREERATHPAMRRASAA